MNEELPGPSEVEAAPGVDDRGGSSSSSRAAALPSSTRRAGKQVDGRVAPGASSSALGAEDVTLEFADCGSGGGKDAGPVAGGATEPPTPVDRAGGAPPPKQAANRAVTWDDGGLSEASSSALGAEDVALGFGGCAGGLGAEWALPRGAPGLGGYPLGQQQGTRSTVLSADPSPVAESLGPAGQPGLFRVGAQLRRAPGLGVCLLEQQGTISPVASADPFQTPESLGATGQPSEHQPRPAPTVSTWTAALNARVTARERAMHAAAEARSDGTRPAPHGGCAERRQTAPGGKAAGGVVMDDAAWAAVELRLRARAEPRRDPCDAGGAAAGGKQPKPRRVTYYASGSEIYEVPAGLTRRGAARAVVLRRLEYLGAAVGGRPSRRGPLEIRAVRLAESAAHAPVRGGEHRPAGEPDSVRVCQEGTDGLSNARTATPPPEPTCRGHPERLGLSVGVRPKNSSSNPGAVKRLRSEPKRRAPADVEWRHETVAKRRQAMEECWLNYTARLEDRLTVRKVPLHHGKLGHDPKRVFAWTAIVAFHAAGRACRQLLDYSKSFRLVFKRKEVAVSAARAAFRRPRNARLARRRVALWAAATRLCCLYFAVQTRARATLAVQRVLQSYNGLLWLRVKQFLAKVRRCQRWVRRFVARKRGMTALLLAHFNAVESQLRDKPDGERSGGGRGKEKRGVLPFVLVPRLPFTLKKRQIECEIASIYAAYRERYKAWVEEAKDAERQMLKASIVTAAATLLRQDVPEPFADSMALSQTLSPCLTTLPPKAGAGPPTSPCTAKRDSVFAFSPPTPTLRPRGAAVPTRTVHIIPIASSTPSQGPGPLSGPRSRFARRRSTVRPAVSPRTEPTRSFSVGSSTVSDAIAPAVCGGFPVQPRLQRMLTKDHMVSVVAHAYHLQTQTEVSWKASAGNKGLSSQRELQAKALRVYHENRKKEAEFLRGLGGESFASLAV
ncbi:hypothetical protein DIPPA_22904 [Diplonema papillatum]|nr:hypothetical protein DIPPA_22904 [Diplonema papillatum]